VATSPTSGPGGGGASVGPSCVLNINPGVDIHAVGTHDFLWNRLFDNRYDFNPLPAIPAGMGLTFFWDGTSAEITPTEDGVWSFTITLSFSGGADANIRASLYNAMIGNGESFGPTVTATPVLTMTEVFALPSGAYGGYRIGVATAAAANPYVVAPSLAITRLA
jgi:hypothetical protein